MFSAGRERVHWEQMSSAFFQEKNKGEDNIPDKNLSFGVKQILFNSDSVAPLVAPALLTALPTESNKTSTAKSCKVLTEPSDKKHYEKHFLRGFWKTEGNNLFSYECRPYHIKLKTNLFGLLLPYNFAMLSNTI